MTKKSLLVTLVLVLVLSSLTACSSKKELSQSDFSKLAEKEGFTVETGQGRFTSKELKTAVQAVNSEKGITIEYYEFNSEKKAKKGFRALKYDVKSTIGISSTVEKNLLNYSLLHVTIKGKYYALVRIENTLIYVETDKANKDAVNEVLENLGYK